MNKPESERLKEPGLKLSTFFEMTPDLVCVAGRDGYFKKVNRAVLEAFGYTEQELMSRPISSFMHPEDRELTLHKRNELFDGKALVNFQNRYVTKTGAIIWLHWTSIYLEDSGVVFAIAKDITEQKKIELDIEAKYKKFKGLAAHFKTSMEEDRKYLARELHEELAQLASVLKMDIEWVKNHSPELSPASKDRIEHAAVISQMLITTIRRLSFYISPNMLEHIGLTATMEWYCREFSILTGIPCRFESEFNEKGLTEEIRIDLFRICQEALMNTLNHAQANHVTVRIEDRVRQLQLTVTDDGQGFDVAKQQRKSGMTRMRERAASINAQLTIDSAPGKGTTVAVTISK
ncbi:MAG TPA: PAS domain-containing sensor histidine kinase [Puia sp.]|jgi:PAS domain S-box-containing protein|nr:PAS domain-containing sensor histidine kinase [Puia sp.]